MAENKALTVKALSSINPNIRTKALFGQVGEASPTLLRPTVGALRWGPDAAQVAPIHYSSGTASKNTIEQISE